MSDLPPVNGKPRKKSGPRTVRGKRSVSQNSRTHGARAVSTIPFIRSCPSRPECACPGAPDTPCPYFTNRARRMIREARTLAHLRREHWPVIREYVATQIRIELLDEWFGKGGWLRASREGLAMHPAFKARIHLSNLLCRLSDLLGLNPTSAAMLKLSDPIDVGGDPALALQAALEEREEREREEAEREARGEAPS